MRPHTFFPFILLLAIFFATPACADEKEPPLAWQDWPSMPAGVFFAAGTLVNDKTVVITGGLNQLAQSITTTQLFDVAAKKWSIGPSLDTRRCMHASVALDDHRVLIVGGKTGDAPNHLKALADACVLDLKTQTFAAVPAMPNAMGQPTAHLLPDGNVLVVGGAIACVYDAAANRWAATIKLQQSREAHCSVLLADGRVLVAGGLNRDSLELIDVKAGVSRLLDVALPEATDDLRAAAMPDGRVWVMGGQHSKTGDTNDRTFFIALAADQAAEGKRVHSTIVEGPALGIAGGASDQCVGRVGPFIFALGGESQQKDKDAELNTVRLLDPRVPKVFTLPPMAIPHDDSIALTIGNSIAVFGGYRVGSGVIPGLVMPTAESRVEALTLPAGKLK